VQRENDLTLYKNGVGFFHHKNMRFDHVRNKLVDNSVAVNMDMTENWHMSNSLIVGRSPNIGPVVGLDRPFATRGLSRQAFGIDFPAVTERIP